MDIKQLLEELQEVINFDSMEDATGTNEIVESELEKPVKMEKAEYKKTDIKKPEIDTVAKKLLGKIKDLKEDASGYLNDEEIADFYKDFKIISIDNIQKKESYYNGETSVYYIGDIEIEFPNADDDYDEFAHDITNDSFIAHNEDGTKVAFDNWYPAEVYEKLSAAVTEAIQAKFLPEDEEGNKLKAITRSDNNKYVIVKNKTTGKFQVNLLDEKEPDLIGAMATTKEFDTVKAALEYTDKKHESVNEEFSVDECISKNKITEVSQETAEKVNIKRQQQALMKTAEAEKAAKEADEANEKAVKNDKLLAKWKKSKGLKESKIVAKYSVDKQIHEIARSKKGLYNIRYNVVEGKPQAVKAGVKSLPVAIDVLKKKFPEAEEIKLNECKLSRKARLQQSLAKTDKVKTK